MCLAVPGKVLQIEERDGIPMAEVDFGGVVKDVCLAYLPDLQVGDYAIVHVGFAIQRLDEESAQETLALLRRVGALGEELGENLGGPSGGPDGGLGGGPSGGPVGGPAGDPDRSESTP
jgi:hydrogenase expression/formation protein HypC